MTDRCQRNITPGKGDIYTFMDCSDRGEGKPVLSDRVIGHWCNYSEKTLAEKYCYCEGAIAHGVCPRGFR